MTEDTHIKAVNALKGINAALKTIDSSTDYYLNKLQLYADVLFGRYAPFKRGDRVSLVKSWTAPEGNKAHGWSGSEHFLIKGAEGEIHGIDVDEDGDFIGYVVFDNEACIDTYDKDKTPKPVIYKHSYGFRESWLEKIKPCTNYCSCSACGLSSK